MRFGITPVNFDVLDESLDLRTLSFPLLVEKAIDAGYEHVEISMDLEYVLPGTLSKRIIKKLLKIKQETEITYSVHLPIWSIEPASPNQKIRDTSCECIVESIKRTESLEPLAYILHPTGALAAEFSRFSLDSNIKKAIINLICGFSSLSLEKILSQTNVAPELLAIENIEFPFDAARQLVDKYNLSICFDTGHLLVGYSGTDTVHQFLEKHMDKIIEFHLNDGKFLANGRPNDHIAIGDGNFPIEIIEKIIKSGFKGPLVFELTFADAEKSLKRLKTHYPTLL